jgi:hypothetical protein
MSDRDKAFGYAVSKWGTSNTPARENLAFADGWKAALDWTMITPSPISDQAAGEPISHERAFHIALVLEMSELCDRNSPENDPSAMVADSNEMAGCIERALERADLVLVPPTAPTTGNPVIGMLTDESLAEYQHRMLNLHMHASPASPAASVLPIQRYAVFETQDGRGSHIVEEPCNIGKWVRYADLASSAVSVPRPSVVTGLLKRIDSAIDRITSGSSLMRVPAEDTDPDLVLAECRALLAASMGGEKA